MPSPVSPSDGFARLPLFGLDFVDGPSVRPVAEMIVGGERSAAGDVPLVVTPNTDIMVQYAAWPEGPEKDFFRNAWLVLPDGQPIVWASAVMGQRLGARLCGSDLFCELWPDLEAKETPTVVVSPSQAVADGLAERHPGATTLVAPMLDVSDPAVFTTFGATVAQAILDRRAEIVILCIGHPKDPMLAAAITNELRRREAEIPFLLCLGGSAEFFLGIKKRAPHWVQRLNAEWLYRFAQEPRRLFHRYFVRDVAFVRLVAQEWWQRRRSASA